MKKMLRRILGFRSGRLASEKGQAVVEFLLVWPFFILLLLVVVDFALALYNYQVVTNSAREGARRAVVADASGPQQVESTIEARLTGGGVTWTSKTPTQTALCTGSLPTTQVPNRQLQLYGCRWEANASSGEQVRVGIRYGYELQMVGGLMRLVGAQRTVTLATDFWMRNE
jgi:hypothetical protein